MADNDTPNPEWLDATLTDSTFHEQPLEATEATPVPEDSRKTGSGSRSTRILLGALLLALAGYIWYSFIYQPAQPQVTVGGNGTPLGAANGVTTVAPRVAGDQLPGVTAQQPGQNGAATPVVVLPLPESALQPARDLEVLDLPFLLTESPADPQDQLADETGDGTTRPTAVRVSVNPFSPVVLAAPAGGQTVPQAVEPAAFPTEPEVIDVSIPDGPDQQAITSIAPPTGTVAVPGTSAGQAAEPVITPAQVPVPTVAAPAPAGQAQAAGSIAQTLPRPLPGPSMSPVPSVLQERRSVSDVPQPNLAQVAAVEEPIGEPAALVTDRIADSGVVTPDPLEPAAARVMPSAADPLVAGITPLSRYLRDNNVSFTGMVLGPVSQGVFRSSLSPRPMVIGLGQALPDTEITLTDLRGQQAEFKLADASQFLTLDLRR